MKPVLVLLPNGSIYRTADVPADGIVLEDPPRVELPGVRDQTAAATGRSDTVVRQKPKYDV